MKAWIKRLASKSVLLCLLPLLLLTFLLHSVHRFPLTKESVLKGKEGQESTGESVLKSKNYVNPLDNILSKRGISTTENVTQYSLSLISKYQLVKVKPVSTSFTSNTSDQAENTLKVKPLTRTLEPPIKSTVADTWKGSQNKVLVLSSVGRSGSSFLGLLFAALGNNMYFFEPIRGLPDEDHNKSNNLAELINYFHCKIRPSLLYIGKGQKADISVIHPYTRNKLKTQVTVEGAMEYCRQEPLIIIKTIRIRLKWIRELMRRKEFDNLKVIHLVRDPRGSFSSMEKLKWNLAAAEVCAKIYEDLQEKETMMSLFPNRYTFIKYEDLCRDPYGQTRRLLQFIHGHGEEGPKSRKETVFSVKPTIHNEKDQTSYRDVPKGVLDFLNDHLHVNRKKISGPFTTNRDTASMYQRWRWTITGKQLETVEASCGHVIRSLGHKMFFNFAAVRDSSLSLFDNEHS